MIQARARMWLGWGWLLVIAFSCVPARVWVWQDDVTLWRDAIRKSPARARAHLLYGMALERRGFVTTAEEEYRMALYLTVNRASQRMRGEQLSAGLHLAERLSKRRAYQEMQEVLAFVGCSPTEQRMTWNCPVQPE